MSGLAEVDIKATTIGEITLAASLKYKDSQTIIDSVERTLLVKVSTTYSCYITPCKVLCGIYRNHPLCPSCLSKCLVSATSPEQINRFDETLHNYIIRPEDLRERK